MMIITDLVEPGDNTIVEWMYRDGSNYKAYGREVLRGRLTREQAQKIKASMPGEQEFLPAQVGLRTLYDLFETHFDDDGMWHELTLLAITTEEPTLDLSADEFASRFTGEWDEDAARQHFDEWVQNTPVGH